MKVLVVTEESMFSNEPLSFEDIVQLSVSAVVNAVPQIMSQVPEEDKENAEGELFDIANVMFSQALAQAFPGMELRPDLTAEAILEAENRIIAERVKEVEEE